MLSILCPQRNANQNNSEIPSYTCQNGQDKKHWWQIAVERMWSKGNTPPLLVGVQTWIAALKISMAISQKIRSESTSRSSNTILGHIPKDAQLYHKDICSTMFVAALFMIARTWKQPRCPSTEEWIKNVVHLHNGILLRSKISDILKFACQWIELRKKSLEWGNPYTERQI